MTRIFEYTETIGERPAAIWIEGENGTFSISVRGPNKGVATISLTADELRFLQDVLSQATAAPDVDKPAKAKKAE